MKTLEEIEQLAEKWCTNVSSSEKLAYIEGYIHCQEDIRKNWQSYTISEKADFIEFLNKQD